MTAPDLERALADTLAQRHDAVAVPDLREGVRRGVRRAARRRAVALGAGSLGAVVLAVAVAVPLLPGSGPDVVTPAGPASSPQPTQPSAEAPPAGPPTQVRGVNLDLAPTSPLGRWRRAFVQCLTVAGTEASATRLVAPPVYFVPVPDDDDGLGMGLGECLGGLPYRTEFAAAPAGFNVREPLLSSTTCLPARLKASPDVVVVGAQVRLTAPAADCELNYAADKTYTVRLLLVGRGEPVELATVPVGPDGALDAVLRLPSDVSPGEASLSVLGSPFDDCALAANSTASCAGYQATIGLVTSVPTSEPG